MSMGRDWLGSIGHELFHNLARAMSACDATRRPHRARASLWGQCTTNPTATFVHTRQSKSHCQDWRSVCLPGALVPSKPRPLPPGPSVP